MVEAARQFKRAMADDFVGKMIDDVSDAV